MAEMRFARLARQYKDRKALAESLVCSWAWATKAIWHLNPLYFEMNGDRPGRPFKKKPSAWRSTFSYGTDDSGRIVVEREPTDFGSYETFYDWSKNPVEVARFSYDKDKSPINLQLALYVDGQLVQIATSAIGGASLESFHLDGPHGTRIEIRFADRTEKGLQKLADYQIVKASYDSDGSVQRVVIDWLPRPPDVRKLTSEVVFNRGGKPVEIDLRKDAIDVQGMLADAVRRYAAKHKVAGTAKKNPPVTRIDLTFSLGDSVVTPWVYLSYDTKPGSEPDGDPTHPDFVKLTRKGWLPAVKAVCNDEVAKVTQANGKTKKCGDAELTETIGKFLVDCLLQARANGVFADLPKADGCELGVEEFWNGEFGWPAYEDRGKKNLVM